MTRDKLQKDAVKALFDNKNLMLQWATGTGKTVPALYAADRVVKRKPVNAKILIVVAELEHKRNWKKEFIKFLGKERTEELFEHITIECYASLKKYVDSEWDLIIFDEAHHLGSELRSEILTSIKSKYVLALSATLGEDVIKILTDSFGKFENSYISLQTAIDNKWLPEPKVYLVPLKLDDSVYSEEIIEEWGTKSKRQVLYCTYRDRMKILGRKKRFFPNVELHIKCTPLQKYKYYTEQHDYWKKEYYLTRNIRVRNKWMQAGSQRKRYLGELKTSLIKDFIKDMDKSGKRYICFCSSIKQANELGKKTAIHSKMNDAQAIIDDFNKGNTNSIYAVGMLQEGVSLNNIQVGIIVQLDGQERVFTQKFGRSLRAEDPVQYIFYFKDTRDEEYLENAIAGIDNTYIKEIEL